MSRMSGSSVRRRRSSLARLRSRSCLNDSIIGQSTEPVGCLKISGTTATLMAIVTMFLVCHTPRLFLNLAEHNFYDIIYTIDEFGCIKIPNWFVIFIEISHFLITMNSAVNFMLYLAVLKKFKAHLKSNFEGLMSHCMNINVSVLDQQEASIETIATTAM